MMRLYALIFVLVVVFRATFLGSEYPQLYYGTLLVYFVVETIRLLSHRSVRINIGGVLFMLIGLLSLCLNHVSPVFRSEMRLTGFLFLMGVVGPLNDSQSSLRFKHLVFDYLRYALWLVTLASFALFFTRVPFAFEHGFNGVMSHSMTLSPVAALGVIYCIDSLSTSRNRAVRVLIVVIMTICAVTMLWSASRGAVGACVVAAYGFIICKYWHQWRRIVKVTLLLTVLIGVVVVWNPFSVLNNIQDKNVNRIEMEDYTAGRVEMWKDRMADFRYSPIYGVGFAAMRSTANSRIDYAEGVVEPGSGWLSILGSMGLLGLVVFACLLFRPLFGITARMPQYAVSAAMLLFFGVHILIEGYSIAFGNPLCVMMWLSIGMGNALMKKRKMLIQNGIR